MTTRNINLRETNDCCMVTYGDDAHENRDALVEVTCVYARKTIAAARVISGGCP